MQPQDQSASADAGTTPQIYAMSIAFWPRAAAPKAYEGSKTSRLRVNKIASIRATTSSTPSIKYQSA